MSPSVNLLSPRPESISDLTSSTLPRWLTVDARMLFSSGIGRYQREILSRWPKENSVEECYICSDAEQESWLGEARPGAKTIRSRAGIYSLSEQALPRHAGPNTVYWVPHYNLPAVCRARLVATVHDAAPLVLKEVFNRRFQQLAARFYFGLARRNTHRIIAVSQFTADELSRHAGINRAKISVIPNGVGEGWFIGDPVGDRPAGRLLFVGNLKAHKNLRRLVEALDVVRARGHEDITLDVVGQIEGFRTGLEAGMVEKLKARPWIRLHGSANDEALQTLYRGAMALVFPSLYEGFGLPMLEAMAAGCPVLASQAASLPEIGGPDQAAGGCVAYFNPYDIPSIADCIERFYRLSAPAKLRMAVDGRERAREYSWEETARRTLHLLKSALPSFVQRTGITTANQE